MSAIAENTHPHQRATSIGIFRLWRDLGYAFGAILAGIISDLIGLESAFIVAAILTALSALIIQFRMPTQ
jgi:predicted MFS family arabinose efflux permease